MIIAAVPRGAVHEEHRRWGWCCRADTEALIKEARRRQRRRYAVTGLAVAAVLASALGAFAGLHGVSQPPPRRPPAGRSGPKPAASHAAGAPAPGRIPRSVDSTVLMWPVGSRAGPLGIYLRQLADPPSPAGLHAQCRSR